MSIFSDSERKILNSVVRTASYVSRRALCGFNKNFSNVKKNIDKNMIAIGKNCVKKTHILCEFPFYLFANFCRKQTSVYSKIAHLIGMFSSE